MNYPTAKSSTLRKKMLTIASSLLVMSVLAGCASTEVTNQQTFVTGQLPRPNRIWVYDFGVTKADVPGSSALTGQLADLPAPATAEDIALGRQLGTEIATQLVARINNMGLLARRATANTSPQINDIVIKGYLLSVVAGSASERMAIGFGSGASELETAVEGFQMTPQGLRKLASGTIDASGSKSPGAALGVAGVIATGNPIGLIVSSGMKVYGEQSGSSTVEGRATKTADLIAKELNVRFQRQGWIQ